MVHLKNEVVNMYYGPGIRSVYKCVLYRPSHVLNYSVIYCQLNLFFLKYSAASRQYITLCVRHIFLHVSYVTMESRVVLSQK
jgi:hypothetical protein